MADGLSIAAGFAEAAGADETGEEGLSGEGALEDVAGSLMSEEGGSDQGGTSDPEIPDFGAEFVEIPGLEEEAGPEGLEEAPPGAPPEDFGDEIMVGSGIAPETEYGPGRTESPSHEEEPPPPDDEVGKTPAPEEIPQVKRRRPRPLSDRRRAEKAEKKLHTTRRVLIGAVVLSALAALLATATGTVDIPGLMWVRGIFPQVQPPPMEVEGRDPVGPVLRYSLQLKAYDQDDLGLAVEMRDALRGRDPQLLFNLSPMLVDGAVTYVLYAGPATDVLEAEELRGPLEGIFEREDPESWRPVVTPRAFYLGREPTLEGAQELLASVEAQGALGYILKAIYSDGSEGFEVLSGAFETAEDARWWQEDLGRKGFEGLALVDRRGSPPE
jgi:hypothetical protein